MSLKISEVRCRKQARKGEGPDSLRSWYLALCVALGTFFCWTGIGATPVLYVGLIQELGISREDASAPFTAMMCVYFLGSVVYGILSKWIGERALLLLGAAATCGSLFAGYFVRDIHLLTYFVGTVHGLGSAVVFVVPMSLLSQYFVKYRATALGIMSVTVSLAGTVFPPVTAFLMDHYGFSATLLLLGVLSLNQLACCIPLTAAPWKDKIGGSGDSRNTSGSPCKSSSFQQDAPVSSMPMSTEVAQSSVTVQTIPEKVCEEDVSSRARTEVQTNSHGSSPSSRVRPFLRASYIHVCISNMCSCFIVFTITLILVDYANDNGITGYRATTLVTLVAVGWMAASILIGQVLDRGILTNESAICSSFLISAVSLTLMVLLKTSFVWMLISSFFVGWGHSSRTFVFFLAVSQWFSGRLLPLAFSLVSFFCFVPFLARTFVIGYVRDQIGCYDSLVLSLAVLASTLTVSWGVLCLSKRAGGENGRCRLLCQRLRGRLFGYEEVSVRGHGVDR